MSPEEEKARYATHENSIENDGYVRFLNRVLHPMLPFLDKTMRGLDYGCGPGPTLSQLVRQHGIACEDYDPLFANGDLRPPYDFILSTECFEHFHNPSQDIHRLCSLLKPGGLLGIMTERWATLEQFAMWNYTTDPTHTSFYHDDTFTFLCNRFALELLWHDENRVMILRRKHDLRDRSGSAIDSETCVTSPDGEARSGNATTLPMTGRANVCRCGGGVLTRSDAYKRIVVRRLRISKPGPDR